MSSIRVSAKVLSVALCVALFGAIAWAGSYQVVYTFQPKTGYGPYNGVIFDAAGNMYGATFAGGTAGCDKGVQGGCGVIFELSPTGDGTWTYSELYNFTGGVDGSHPFSTLVMDAAGNLYGTTFGKNNGAGSGLGTAFELSPTASGAWKFTLLHTFAGGKDGRTPAGTLALDQSGNVYGSTWYGGSNDLGVVFQLSATSNGTWKETLLHSFTGCQDGGIPNGVVADAKGAIYVTAQRGGVACGINGYGVILELSPQNGRWKQSIVHTFTGGVDGSNPAMLTFSSNGTLYGIAASAGRGYGLAFQLTPKPNGNWSLLVLHDFDGQNGLYPNSIAENGGNLYGTTDNGGFGLGVLFELIADTNWTETVLTDFNTPIGELPYGSMAFDSAGNVYGTTLAGGSTGGGVVYEYIP